MEPEEVIDKTGLTFLHTAHCLGSGEIMISAMGNKEYEQEGMLYLSVELHRLKFFVDDEFESIASALRV